MALSLYTHTVSPQEHNVEINCWIVHCMAPSAKPSMKMMFGGYGMPLYKKQGNSVTPD